MTGRTIKRHPKVYPEKTMNSYQKRKQEIEYLEQCITELKQTCFLLVESVPKRTLPALFPFGLAGDRPLTAYNNGEFYYQLLHKNQR